MTSDLTPGFVNFFLTRQKRTKISTTWGEDLKRSFAQETRIAIKYMKRRFYHSRWEIENLSPYEIILEKLKWKRLTTSNLGRKRSKWDCHTLLVVVQNSIIALWNIWQLPFKVKCLPAILLPGFTQENRTFMHTNTCTKMHYSQNWKECQCSTGELINKFWYINVIQYY